MAVAFSQYAAATLVSEILKGVKYDRLGKQFGCLKSLDRYNGGGSISLHVPLTGPVVTLTIDIPNNNICQIL